MELLQYISWCGFRGSVDQVLLKMDYALESEKDRVYNICLERDFNLNILMILGDSKVA
jgi:hypothetical protein